ncbi:hypothetical protein HDF11_005260 [Tunturiibacter psychrotolerans]
MEFHDNSIRPDAIRMSPAKLRSAMCPQQWYLIVCNGCLRTDELRQNEDSVDDNGELRTEPGVLTLEGVPYKESVSALVTFWSQSREKLQDEING